MKIIYTDEQKREALEMLEKMGPTKTRKCLGIPSATLYRWKGSLARLGQTDSGQGGDDALVPMLEEATPEVLASDTDMEEDARLIKEEASFQQEEFEGIQIDMDDKDGLVLGGLLMKLKYVEKENALLREKNDSLRKSMVALLRGDTYE